jgi:DNA invertase Pin-like site-specific DNA recombinase
MLVGYIRVSTSGQVKHGEGLAIQRARIEGWSKFQGFEAPTVHEDAGISGCSTDGRDAFKSALRAVLTAASGGEKSTFVCASLDRLGRNMVDALETAEVLEDAGVRLVTLDGIDTGSTMGKQSLKALLAVKAMVADMERDAIIARLQGGRAHARAEGRKYTSEAPFGQRTEGRELVVDLEEQRALARIKELRAAGVSYRSIRTALEAEGLRPRRGKTWSLALLHRLATGKQAAPPKKQSARVARARAALLTEEKAA